MSRREAGEGYVEVRGARVLSPFEGIDEVRSLFVTDGRLSFREPSGRPVVRLDAAGLLALPGFVEIHAHLREPGFTESETVATGLAAARAGGYAAVFAMANTKPVNDRPEVTREIAARAVESRVPVRLYPVTAVTKGLLGRELADFAAQKRAGAGAASDDGRPVADERLMARAMQAAAAAGLPIFSHATHDPGPGGGVVNAGAAAARLGVRGLAPEEEDELVEREVRLARETGAPVHVCHVSTARGVDAVRRGKAGGAPVTAEAAPHHLLLTDREVTGPDEKMNPPLRSPEDREAVVAGLAEGVLDAVATDHAPHAPLKKASGLREAPFGVIGMESAFPALFTGLVLTGTLPLATLVTRMTAGPARIGRVPGGAFTRTSRAEVTLVDPETEFVLAPELLRSKSRNCPFLGRRLRGRVVGTLLGNSLDILPGERNRAVRL